MTARGPLNYLIPLNHLRRIFLLLPTRILVNYFITLHNITYQRRIIDFYIPLCSSTELADRRQLGTEESPTDICESRPGDLHFELCPRRS